jgi:hypothetical protein
VDVVGTETFSDEEPVYLSEEKSTMIYIVESGNVELRLMRRGKNGSFHVVCGGISKTNNNYSDGSVGSEEVFSTARGGDSSSRSLSTKHFNFGGVEYDKKLKAGDHFGTEAVLSIAMGIEHISKMSAYAVGAKTELITLASEDLIRIVGEKWLREYATGVKSENSSSKVVAESTAQNRNSHSTPLNRSDLSNEDEDEDEGDTLGPLANVNTSLPVHRRSRTISEYSDAQLPDNWRDKSIGSLADLEIMQVIGKGSFGEVVLAKVKGIERLVAVKKLKKHDLASSGCTPHVMNERKALALSSGCPFIVNMFNTFSDKRYVN